MLPEYIGIPTFYESIPPKNVYYHFIEIIYNYIYIYIYIYIFIYCI